MSTTTDMPIAATPMGPWGDDPEPPIASRSWDRLADAAAGWRDRRPMTSPGGMAGSWSLRRLRDECAAQLDAERHAALGEFAALDRDIAAERNTITVSATRLLEALEARQRARGAEADRLDARASDDRSAIHAAHGAIARISSARSSRWATLVARAFRLVAHYEKRAATYARATTGRGGVPLRPSPMPTPSWLTDDPTMR